MLVDFILLCREQRIPYLEEGNHHCHDGWIQVPCPFCGDGNDGWHLGYNIEFGNMNCWRCGKHNIFEWLKKVLPNSIKHKVPAIIQQYQITGHKKHVVKPEMVRKRNIKPPFGSKSLGTRHIQYLKSRSFEPKKLIPLWNLQGTFNLSKSWNWRIIAPIHNQDRQIVAYTGRALSDEIRPRWKTSENEEMVEDPKKLIYGIEKVNPEKGVLIVEGPSDVWRMGPGAVGLLGIDWKVEQAGILSHLNIALLCSTQKSKLKKRQKS